MTATDETEISPQEVGERFDLLVADVREYAIFNPGEADRHRPQQAGLNHHFVKPIDLKKLLELLEAAAPKESLANFHLNR